MMTPNPVLLEFHNAIGEQYVLQGDDEKSPYLRDWGKRYQGSALAVLKPKNTEEVAKLVKICMANRISIVPQGGNTGLCGGATPDNSGNSVVICLSRLNQIREVDTQNATMTVDAGVILQQAQHAALEEGKLFPLSLAAEGSCTIGGNLATNAGGVQVLRYGNMRDLTLGLEVVTANGDIWNGLRGLRKDNTGYSLKDLFIGSEGTLGIITAATLKLYPIPKSKITALISLTTVANGIRLLQYIQKNCSADLTAFELISRRAIELVCDKFVLAKQVLESESAWMVLFELSSMDSEEKIRLEIQDILAQAIEDDLIEDAIVAESIQQSKTIWEIRETIPEAQLQLGNIIKHDISLPISELSEFIENTNAQLRKTWPDSEVIVFGHVGDGNLHYNLAGLNNGTSDQLPSRRHDINQLVHDQVYLHQGSFSAEHGIGQAKMNELAERKSDVEMNLMRAIKESLDPLCIMNPNKVIKAFNPKP
ncbi:MAG: FAD-binding oxidoreductase [Polynucleobacter sp.]|nr:FAD-binding oxidoreductase [Polynucleobacter sp.]